MKTKFVWQQWMVAAGYAAMLVGALDPMEGSLLILPGSALVALGTYLDKGEKFRAGPRLTAFIMIALGVGSLWGLSQVGGFGGSSGRSMWWGTPILLYLAGWSWDVWAKGTPRWVSYAGMAVGLFYLAIPFLAMRAGRAEFIAALVVVALSGLATVIGCVRRLWLSDCPSAEAMSGGV